MPNLSLSYFLCNFARMKPLRIFATFGNKPTKIWWLILFLLSVASMIDIFTAPVFHFSVPAIIFYLVTVCAFKATLLTLIGVWLWRKPLFKVVLIICFALFAILSLINIGSWGLYGFGFSRKLLSLIAQTNFSEVKELLPDIWFKLKDILSGLTVWLFVGGAVLLFILFRQIPQTIFRYAAICLSCIGVGVMVWFSVSFTTGRVGFFFATRIPKYTYAMIQNNREVEAYLKSQTSLPHPESIKTEHLAENIIVIIGESVNNSNMQVYGYPLPNSPEMASRADSLFIFQDVISSASITIPSIENMMTFRPDNNPDSKWNDYPRVIDLFNAAGYHTSWISNQERAGMWANSIGAISGTADYINFIGLEYPQDSFIENKMLDDDLFPVIKKVLSQPAEYNFMVVHVMGSHWEYAKRYPEEFNKFSAADVHNKIKSPWLTKEKAQIVAEYNNSIAFTDYLWGQIAALIEASPKPSLLIYVSDHGESVFDKRDFRGRDLEHVRIPFVILANDAFMEQNPEKTAAMRSALDRPFSSATLVNMLINLTGTTYELYDPVSDPLSADFKPHHRYVDDEPWPYEKVSQPQ